MAYPTALDELTDGVPADGVAATTALGDSTYQHDDHHRALGVAGEALEAKVGIGASAATGASTGDVLRITSPGTSAWASLATVYQPLDTDLTAIAALTSAADKVPYSTGAGTWALADFSAAGRALVDDADAAAQRTTLGLVIGTNVQAYDADLAALAGVTSAADALPYFTGAGTASTTTLTAAARTVLDDTTVAAMLTTLGGAPIANPTFTGTVTTGAGGIVGQVYTSDAATGTNAAGSSNTGTSVTAVGQAAAKANSGSESVMVGIFAGASNTGEEVSLIGRYAGYQNTGTGVTGVGRLAAYQNTGASVTAIGHGAGVSNTYGDVILLGRSAVAAATNEMVIGSATYPANRWIPGHDPNTYLDIAAADTWKIYAGGQKGIEVNATGGAPYLGFFGTAAVAKPTGVAVSAAGIHAALVTLGLIAA